ncbi:hypothetical protein MILUP08_45971 [Micromonospora lupini str. Lupac 08]|uniref:Uncharacterized protein n=1 Tax=Micromonospora lupini str. Lupac 08 TaxID=1150864 RepID=I0LB80_9ACTN|nr:hypothetical protein MILUP08_45971 [Micromonospora lupini str. Lupac 08]
MSTGKTGGIVHMILLLLPGATGRFTVSRWRVSRREPGPSADSGRMPLSYPTVTS